MKFGTALFTQGVPPESLSQKRWRHIYVKMNHNPKDFNEMSHASQGYMPDTKAVYARKMEYVCPQAKSVYHSSACVVWHPSRSQTGGSSGFCWVRDHTHAPCGPAAERGGCGEANTRCSRHSHQYCTAGGATTQQIRVGESRQPPRERLHRHQQEVQPEGL